MYFTGDFMQRMILFGFDRGKVYPAGRCPAALYSQHHRVELHLKALSGSQLNPFEEDRSWLFGKR